jgi:hypothetical protein
MGVVAHTCNPAICEVAIEGSCSEASPGKKHETLSEKETKTQKS